MYNRNEDFYKVVERGMVPEHDVLVTNPPYSADHMQRCLRFCAANGRPWLLLLPNFVYRKRDYLGILGEARSVAKCLEATGALRTRERRLKPIPDTTPLSAALRPFAHLPDLALLCPSAYPPAVLVSPAAPAAAGRRALLPLPSPFEALRVLRAREAGGAHAGHVALRLVLVLQFGASGASGAARLVVRGAQSNAPHHDGVGGSERARASLAFRSMRPRWVEVPEASNDARSHIARNSSSHFKSIHQRESAHPSALLRSFARVE